MENEKLLKKLAQSYSFSTGVEFDDLFQEAYIAYHKAMQTFDPQKSKLSTYIWHCVSSHLKNYVKLEKNHLAPICSIEDANVVNKPGLSVTNFWDALSFEAQQIGKIILESSRIYNSGDLKSVSKKITQTMIRRGWNKKKIRIGLHDLELACQ